MIGDRVTFGVGTTDATATGEAGVGVGGAGVGAGLGVGGGVGVDAGTGGIGFSVPGTKTDLSELAFSSHALNTANVDMTTPTKHIQIESERCP